MSVGELESLLCQTLGNRGLTVVGGCFFLLARGRQAELECGIVVREGRELVLEGAQLRSCRSWRRGPTLTPRPSGKS